MRRERKDPCSCDTLFNTKGEFKQRVKLSSFFLRKPYQYTIAEPKDDTQQKLHEDDWKKIDI